MVSLCASAVSRTELQYMVRGIQNDHRQLGGVVVAAFTPWSRVLLGKLIGSQLVKKVPAFYGTRRFITAFTSSRHLSLSWARSIRSIPPPTCQISCPFSAAYVVPQYQSRSEALVNNSWQDTFLLWGLVSTSPIPQAGGPPLVGCPQLLIQYIRSYPPYWRPFLHPQPEDAPCCGDRDWLITVV